MGLSATDRGSALIEFTFVAVLVLVPLLYLVVSVAAVGQARLAVTAAAREVGRAIQTTPAGDDADARALAALTISLRPAHLAPADVTLSYVEATASCPRTGQDRVPALTPGLTFAVCVVRHQGVPGVPSVLNGRGVTLIGRYVVRVDRYRQTGLAGPDTSAGPRTLDAIADTNPHPAGTTPATSSTVPATAGAVRATAGTVPATAGTVRATAGTVPATSDTSPSPAGTNIATAAGP